MKRVLVVVLITIAFSLTSVVLCSAASPGPVKLKYSNFLPATHPYSVLNGQFCEEIKKRTNGRLDITYYPGGTLTSATKVYDGVVK